MSPAPPAASASRAAERFAGMGLKVCLADLRSEALEPAVAEVGAVSTMGSDAVLAVPTDVSRLDDSA